MKRSLWEHFCRRIERWNGYEFRQIQSLVVEPTNHCTLECPVCGALQSDTQRVKGYMDWDLFVQLAAEISMLRPSRVCLHAHGEPLLHPRLVDMVRELASRKLQCEIITNGDLLTCELSLALREAGLTSLIISHPGICAANYDACRGCPLSPEKEEKLIESLRFWEGAAAKVGIQSMVIPALVSDRGEFLSFAKKWLNVPGVQEVSFHGYLPWPRHFREDMLRFLAAVPRRCELGMLSLTVLWDGTVTACSYDTSAELKLGRFPELSLSQMYNGLTLRRMRRDWFRKITHWPAICRACLIPRCKVPLVAITLEKMRKHLGDVHSEQEYLRSILIPFDHALFSQRVYY